MSAVLGHEIRNPLASLKGHAQLLLEKLPADHPLRPKAETIVREAVRLEELSGHILDFARSGEPALLETDPASLARAAADMDPDRVRLLLAGPLPSVQVDAPRIEQALSNLLRNALQVSPDGAAVDLAVRAEAPWLVIEVRDRGPGIPPGDEQRLFEPFYTTRVQGTGLGLAVAHRIVTAHGGRIAVANHPEGGAIFRVELPLRPRRDVRGTLEE
jgi:two-component system sensor histidine kinase HydH